MKLKILLVACVLVYVALLSPFSGYMKNKPFAEKLGYAPQPEMLRLASADQKQFLASMMVMRTLLYFGTLVEKSSAKIDIPPDYFAIYKIMSSVIKLDPYNMDAYYFSQAILVWDVKRIKEVNALLEYGMEYRTWDFYLPFFAGFNYSYFLKDYERAAFYYRKAAAITGDELHVKLAGRYLYESGNTAQAIAYLKIMIRGAKNAAIRKSFQKRLLAFEETRMAELATEKFMREKGILPTSLDQLVEEGYLGRMPVDPYGGRFFIDSDGRVRTTSKFAQVKKN